jgi:hypothetical protein
VVANPHPSCVEKPPIQHLNKNVCLKIKKVPPALGEKNTNWEGGWRMPCAVRWPGVVKPGSISNGIVHHMDWLPTFLAAAGKTDIKKDLSDHIAT